MRLVSAVRSRLGTDTSRSWDGRSWMQRACANAVIDGDGSLSDVQSPRFRHKTPLFATASPESSIHATAG